MDRILIGADFEGRYRIESELGSGGVGTVYRATHLKLGRPVAIKVLQEKYGASRELRHRFEREAHALAALSHPHIVTVTDFGVSHGMPYLVMELLDGETLSDCLERGPLDGTDAIDVVRQVLRALTFVHEQGLVHRDMKPGNIFLQTVPGSRPHVKILDFGLAKFLERDGTTTALTRAGQVFGTPSYMAPEQVGAENTDARTDLYAVGIILFEMLAGRPPFRGDVTEVMRQQLVEPLPSIGSVCKGREASPELRAVLERATAKRRSARYQNAQELADALDALSPAALEIGDPATRATTVAAHRPSPHPAPPETGRYVATTESGTERRRPMWVHVAPPVVALVALTVALFVLKNSASNGEEPSPSEQAGASAAVPLPATVGSAPPVVEVAQKRVPESPPSAPEATASVEASPDPSPDPVPEPPPHQQFKTVDELWAGAPKLLVASLEAVDRGIPLSKKTIAWVHEYNGKNPGDPRGYLLLAHSYMLKGWRKDATNQYAIAYKMNPDVTVDPQMQRDLVDSVLHGSTAAKDLLKQAYGKRAIAAVDDALRKAGPNRVLAERLRKLRDELSR